MSLLRRTSLVLTTLAGLLLVGGCQEASGASSGAGAPAPAAVPPAAGLSVVDPWVKAADSGMTAVFGTLRNAGPAPIVITSAATSASGRTELHETVTGEDGPAMRPVQDGLTIEPGRSRELVPGGDHIMIMDLAGPVHVGDQVEVTLQLADGSVVPFTALAKETTSGEENYEPDHTHGPGDQHLPGGARVNGEPGP